MADSNYFKSIQLSDAEKFAPPAVFSAVCEKMLPLLGAMAFVAEEPEERELRIYFFEKELAEHAPPFVAMVKALAKSKEQISFATAVRLYGFGNTLAFLAGVRLWEAANHQVFPWDSQTGQPKADAKAITQFLRRAVEELGEDGRYRRSAVLSGIAFDVVALLNQQEKSAWFRKVERWTDEMFGASLKTAQAAMTLGRNRRDLSLESHMVEAIFLRKVGRLALAVFEKGYLEMSQALEKELVPRRLWGIAERKFCGISSNRISALISQFIPGASAISLALLAYDFPFLLAGPGEKDLQDLADLCEQASQD